MPCPLRGSALGTRPHAQLAEQIWGWGVLHHARAPHQCTPVLQRPPAPCLHSSTALIAPSTCQGSRAPGTAMGPTQNPQSVAKGSISCLLLGCSWGCSRPSTGSMPATTWTFFEEGLVPCFFCLFSGCQNTPSAQEQAQLKTGLPGGHRCAPGDGCSQFLCPGAATQPLSPSSTPQSLFGAHSAFGRPPGQGGEGSRTCCMHAATHVQLPGPWHRCIPPVRPRGNRTCQRRHVGS